MYMSKISAVGLFCLDKFENNQMRTSTTFFPTSKLTEVYFNFINFTNFKYCDVKSMFYSVHKNIKNYQCEECAQRFSAKRALDKHYEVIHLQIKKYQCLKCDYKTSDKSTLKNHTLVKHTKNPKFECKHCNFVTNICKRLKVHNAKEHPTRRKCL